MAGTVCRCIQRYSLSTPAALFNAQFLPINQHFMKPKSSSVFRLHLSNYSTETEKAELSKEDVLDEKIKEKNMSTAMRLYLQRKRDHDMFIAREESEFQIGQQHLANMMGLDHQSMTQEDIDKSIEYLFPSGLLPEARPIMKPPAQIFPRQKEAEFDVDGRPYQTFFYTLKPNLNQRQFELRDCMDAVTIFGDRLNKQGKWADSKQVLDISKVADSRWLNKQELETMCVETISDKEYAEFINTLSRLLELPFSYRVKDEIFKYRVTDIAAQSAQSYLTPDYDEDGRAFVQFEGRRKTAVATVKVTKPGTGELRIVNEVAPHYMLDISYFFALKDRLQIIYPLQFTKLLGLVDLDVSVVGSGSSAQAGAIRYATAMCLRSFVDKDMVDDMKINGLLTQDIRVSERKKFGKVKARKSYTWKRR
jgi:small subunit ribosomal protein S9